MKRYYILCFACLLYAAVRCAAEESADKPAVTPENTAAVSPDDNDTAIDLKHTVITSKRLTYDKELSFALFEEDVVVEDPQINITASLLRVVFDANDQVVTLEAEGSVRMMQDDRISFSETARYDVEEGRIVLDGNPRVRRGGHEISGDRIVFWRNDNRMLVEPNARVRIIFDGEDQGGAGFLGVVREK